MNGLVFNMHDVLQLITAGLALLLAVPLLLQRDPQRTEILLAGFLVTQGVSSFYSVLLFSPLLRLHTLDTLFPLHNFPLALVYLLQGLLLLGYSYAMAGRRLLLTAADRNALVAWLLLNLAQGLSFAIDSDKFGMDVGLVEVFPGLVLSAYFGLRAIGVLRCYNREIRQHYSNIDDINLLWLSLAAFGFVGTWLLRLGSYVPGMLGDQEAADLLGMLSNYPSLLLISWMVVLGVQQGSSGQPALATSEKIVNGRREADPQRVEQLEDLMQRVRLYQDPELDLEGLADSLGISARSLSTLINGHYGKNFYDFVNGYRIEVAKQQLADPDQLDKTIQRIFEDAGFNSKSTFNTLFKRATGMTPSSFRKQRLKTARAGLRQPAAP